jgi:3-oxoacyl-(acyl-carrier-protein) synthase
MTLLPCGAEILAMGVLRPESVPVMHPAPPAIAQAEWPAYRLSPAAEQALFPAGRVKRLGRGQAMALRAVQLALDSSEAPPAHGSTTAVAIGTAWAEEGDEIVFVEQLVRLGEKGAKPSFFVNSVKNALASQVALHFGFLGENQTFHHDALSFETALWQGARLLHAGRAERAVVVGVDALFQFCETEGHLLGQLRSDLAELAPLSEPRHPADRGSLPGEGAAAFLLAPSGAARSPLARLVGVRARGSLERAPTLDPGFEVAFIRQALNDFGANPSDLGGIVLGANGDPALDAHHAAIARDFRAQAPRAGIGVYRHQTGDFATASALGLAVAVEAVRGDTSPDGVRWIGETPARMTLVLLYHLTARGFRSVMLVARGGESLP